MGTFQTRKTVLPKQVFAIQRGKGEYEDFLSFIIRLNQRQSPPAPLNLTTITIPTVKTGTMMKMQESRSATKTSSRVAAFVAFVAAAVLLEGRGAHAATSGICKTPANFKPDLTFDTGAWGFGTQTCQSTVWFWQSMFGEVFDASWSCEGKPSNVQAIVLGISSYGCCDGPET